MPFVCSMLFKDLSPRASFLRGSNFGHMIRIRMTRAFHSHSMQIDFIHCMYLDNYYAKVPKKEMDVLRMRLDGDKNVDFLLSSFFFF